MGTTDFTQRNTGIDLLRALTMLVMLFVNDFWKIHDVPTWLEHAGFGQDFMGLADVVFPCFLFVVGMSIPFAIEARFRKGVPGENIVGHIFSRTLALLVMGVFITNSEARLSEDVPYSIGIYWILMVTAFFLIWNQYPPNPGKIRKKLYVLFQWLGAGILLFLAITFRDPKGGVFSAQWGILGAIGWTYLLCALIYVFTRDNLKYLIPVWMAFVVVCMLNTPLKEGWGKETLLQLPFPNFYHQILYTLHIGNGALPAFTMGGVIFSLLTTRYGHIKKHKKALLTIVAAGVFGLAGFTAHRFWIVSKLSATPPWIFYVTGIAIAVYGLLTWLNEQDLAGWLRLISPAGTATLTCYLLPYVSYALADLTGIVLPDWLTHHPWGLVNSFCFALVIILATWLAGKLRLKIKI